MQVRAKLVDEAITWFEGAKFGIDDHLRNVEHAARDSTAHATLPDVASWTNTYVLDGIALLKRAEFPETSDAVKLARSAAAKLELLSAPTHDASGLLPDLKAAGLDLNGAIAKARDFASYEVRVRPSYG